MYILKYFKRSFLKRHLFCLTDKWPTDKWPIFHKHKFTFLKRHLFSLSEFSSSQEVSMPVIQSHIFFSLTTYLHSSKNL